MEDEDASFQWWHECAVCLALRKGISEREAMSEIIRSSASFRSSEKRNAGSKAALQKQMELMPALSETKKGMKRIRQITRESCKELWMPLMEAIVIKTGHMFIVCEAQERRKVLIDELRTCVDQERAQEILAELNELARADRLVAFGRHSVEIQDRFQLAATYSDEWVKGNGPTALSVCGCFGSARSTPMECDGKAIARVGAST